MGTMECRNENKKKERCTRGRNLRGDGAVSRATKKMILMFEGKNDGEDGKAKRGGVTSKAADDSTNWVLFQFILNL